MGPAADPTARECSTRRTFLISLTLAGAFLPFGVSVGATAGSNVTKAAAWRLGDDLSIAALLYAQGGAQDKSDQMLSKAQSLARELGVTIKPFPPRARKETETMADIIHYLIKGDGAAIGTALSRKYDRQHEYLFEVSTKSNLLYKLYAPGDSLGMSIASVIRSRSEEIGLPPALWSGVVAAITGKRSAEDVRSAVAKMHKDVVDYFLART